MELDAWEQQLSRTGGLRIPQATAWALSAPQLAWLAVQGTAASLSLLAAANPVLAWHDVAMELRELAVLSTGSGAGAAVLGIPYDIDPPLLFYRRDALAALGLSVPRTWDQLLVTAAALDVAQRQCSSESGTSSGSSSGPCYGRGFCLVLPAGCSSDGMLLSAVWASMAAVQGPKQGLYFTADGMVPRFGGAAMAEAVAVFRNLSLLSDADQPLCTHVDVDTARRSCAMGIAGSSVVRLLAWPGQLPTNTTPQATFGAGDSGDTAGVSSVGATATAAATAATGTRPGYASWLGWTGVAPLPGSPRVEDPASGAMRDCDADLCPFAELAPDGRTRVNRAPHPGRGPFFLALRRGADLASQVAVWRAMSAALSPEASWARVTDPRVVVSPVRAGQLAPGAQDRWAAAGWYEADAAEYLAAVRDSLEHPNAVPPLRFLGGEKVVALMAGGAAVAAREGPPPADVAKELLSNVSLYFPGGLFLLQKSYLQSIGARGHVVLGRTMEPNVEAAASGGGSGKRAMQDKDRIGVAVGVVVGVLVLVASAVFKRKSLQLRGPGGFRRRRKSAAAMPGYGPQTTLVVTDIQDSTQLWETLPPIVMDLSLNLHNHCVRQLVRRYQGYETHTEGDSFTLAFHTAVEATAFALELQTSLMELNWPVLLLEHSSAAEVFLTTTKAAAAAAAATAAAAAATGAAAGIIAGAPTPNYPLSEASPRTTPPSQRLLSLNAGASGEHTVSHSGGPGSIGGVSLAPYGSGTAVMAARHPPLAGYMSFISNPEPGRAVSRSTLLPAIATALGLSLKKSASLNAAAVAEAAADAGAGGSGGTGSDCRASELDGGPGPGRGRNKRAHTARGLLRTLGAHTSRSLGEPALAMMLLGTSRPAAGAAATTKKTTTTTTTMIRTNESAEGVGGVFGRLSLGSTSHRVVPFEGGGGGPGDSGGGPFLERFRYGSGKASGSGAGRGDEGVGGRGPDNVRHVPSHPPPPLLIPRSEASVAQRTLSSRSGGIFGRTSTSASGTASGSGSVRGEYDTGSGVGVAAAAMLATSPPGGAVAAGLPPRSVSTSRGGLAGGGLARPTSLSFMSRWPTGIHSGGPLTAATAAATSPPLLQHQRTINLPHQQQSKTAAVAAAGALRPPLPTSLRRRSAMAIPYGTGRRSLTPSQSGGDWGGGITAASGGSTASASGEILVPVASGGSLVVPGAPSRSMSRFALAAHVAGAHSPSGSRWALQPQSRSQSQSLSLSVSRNPGSWLQRPPTLQLSVVSAGVQDAAAAAAAAAAPGQRQGSPTEGRPLMRQRSMSMDGGPVGRSVALAMAAAAAAGPRADDGSMARCMSGDGVAAGVRGVSLQGGLAGALAGASERSDDEDIGVAASSDASSDRGDGVAGPGGGEAAPLTVRTVGVGALQGSNAFNTMSSGPHRGAATTSSSADSIAGAAAGAALTATSGDAGGGERSRTLAGLGTGQGSGSATGSTAGSGAGPFGSGGERVRESSCLAVTLSSAVAAAAVGLEDHGRELSASLRAYAQPPRHLNVFRRSKAQSSDGSSSHVAPGGFARVDMPYKDGAVIIGGDSAAGAAAREMSAEVLQSEGAPSGVSTRAVAAAAATAAAAAAAKEVMAVVGKLSPLCDSAGFDSGSQAMTGEQPQTARIPRSCSGALQQVAAVLDIGPPVQTRSSPRWGLRRGVSLLPISGRRAVSGTLYGRSSAASGPAAYRPAQPPASYLSGGAAATVEEDPIQFVSVAAGGVSGGGGGPPAPRAGARRANRSSHSGVLQGSLQNLSRRFSDSLSYAKLALTGGGGAAVAAAAGGESQTAHGSVNTGGGSAHPTSSEFPGICEVDGEEGEGGDGLGVGVSASLYPLPPPRQSLNGGLLTAGSGGAESPATTTATAQLFVYPQRSGTPPTPPPPLSQHQLPYQPQLQQQQQQQQQQPYSGKVGGERPSSQRTSRRAFWRGQSKVARSFAAALLYETLRAASSTALGTGAGASQQNQHRQPQPQHQQHAATASPPSAPTPPTPPPPPPVQTSFKSRRQHSCGQTHPAGYPSVHPQPYPYGGPNPCLHPPSHTHPSLALRQQQKPQHSRTSPSAVASAHTHPHQHLAGTGTGAAAPGMTGRVAAVGGGGGGGPFAWATRPGGFFAALMGTGGTCSTPKSPPCGSGATPEASMTASVQSAAVTVISPSIVVHTAGGGGTSSAAATAGGVTGSYGQLCGSAEALPQLPDVYSNADLGTGEYSMLPQSSWYGNMPGEPGAGGGTAAAGCSRNRSSLFVLPSQMSHGSFKSEPSAARILSQYTAAGSQTGVFYCSPLAHQSAGGGSGPVGQEGSDVPPPADPATSGGYQFRHLRQQLQHQHQLQQAAGARSGPYPANNGLMAPQQQQHSDKQQPQSRCGGGDAAAPPRISSPPPLMVPPSWSPGGHLRSQASGQVQTPTSRQRPLSRTGEGRDEAEGEEDVGGSPVSVQRQVQATELQRSGVVEVGGAAPPSGCGSGRWATASGSFRASAAGMMLRLRAGSRRRMASHTSGSGRPDVGGQVLLFRGFRVRVGLHSGLDEGSDVFWTKRSGRRAYSGPAMRHARLLSDAALGGMVVMSESCLRLLQPLPNEQLPAGALLWHAGRFRLSDKDGCADLDVFQALLPALLPRLQAFRGVPLRVTAALMPGLLDAPVGPVALAACQVVGVEVLRSWNLEVAEEALGMFRWQAAAVAAGCGGTLVELDGGSAVAAFTGAYPAVTSLLTLEDDLKSCVPWPAALLEHELGEEITCLLPPGVDDVVVTQLVHCGPRVRCAAEWFSDVRLDMSITRAIQLYRNASSGKPWKNLQRMLRLAKMGQTLISAPVQRLLVCSGGPLLEYIQVEPVASVPTATSLLPAPAQAFASPLPGSGGGGRGGSIVIGGVGGGGGGNVHPTYGSITHDGFISSPANVITGGLHPALSTPPRGSKLMRQRSAEQGFLGTALMALRSSRASNGGLHSSAAGGGDGGGGGSPTTSTNGAGGKIKYFEGGAALAAAEAFAAAEAAAVGMGAVGGGAGADAGGGGWATPGGPSGLSGGRVVRVVRSRVLRGSEPGEQQQPLQGAEEAVNRRSGPVGKLSAVCGPAAMAPDALARGMPRDWGQPLATAASVDAVGPRQRQQRQRPLHRGGAAVGRPAGVSSEDGSGAAAKYARYGAGMRGREGPAAAAAAAAAAAVFGPVSGAVSPGGHPRGGTSTSAANSSNPSDGSDLDHWQPLRGTTSHPGGLTSVCEGPTGQSRWAVSANGAAGETGGGGGSATGGGGASTTGSRSRLATQSPVVMPSHLVVLGPESVSDAAAVAAAGGGGYTLEAASTAMSEATAAMPGLLTATVGTVIVSANATVDGDPRVRANFDGRSSTVDFSSCALVRLTEGCSGANAATQATVAAAAGAAFNGGGLCRSSDGTLHAAAAAVLAAATAAQRHGTTAAGSDGVGPAVSGLLISPDGEFELSPRHSIQSTDPRVSTGSAQTSIRLSQRASTGEVSSRMDSVLVPYGMRNQSSLLLSVLTGGDVAGSPSTAVVGTAGGGSGLGVIVGSSGGGGGLMGPSQLHQSLALANVPYGRGSRRDLGGDAASAVNGGDGIHANKPSGPVTQVMASRQNLTPYSIPDPATSSTGTSPSGATSPVAAPPQLQLPYGASRRGSLTFSRSHLAPHPAPSSNTSPGGLVAAAAAATASASLGALGHTPPTSSRPSAALLLPPSLAPQQQTAQSPSASLAQALTPHGPPRHNSKPPAHARSLSHHQLQLQQQVRSQSSWLHRPPTTSLSSSVSMSQLGAVSLQPAGVQEQHSEPLAVGRLKQLPTTARAAPSEPQQPQLPQQGQSTQQTTAAAAAATTIGAAGHGVGAGALRPGAPAEAPMLRCPTSWSLSPTPSPRGGQQDSYRSPSPPLPLPSPGAPGAGWPSPSCAVRRGPAQRSQSQSQAEPSSQRQGLSTAEAQPQSRSLPQLGTQLAAVLPSCPTGHSPLQAPFPCQPPVSSQPPGRVPAAMGPPPQLSWPQSQQAAVAAAAGVGWGSGADARRTSPPVASSLVPTSEIAPATSGSAPASPVEPLSPSLSPSGRRQRPQPPPQLALRPPEADSSATPGSGAGGGAAGTPPQLAAPAPHPRAQAPQVGRGRELRHSHGQRGQRLLASSPPGCPSVLSAAAAAAATATATAAATAAPGAAAVAGGDKSPRPGGLSGATGGPGGAVSGKGYTEPWDSSAGGLPLASEGQKSPLWTHRAGRQGLAQEMAAAAAAGSLRVPHDGGGSGELQCSSSLRRTGSPERAQIVWSRAPPAVQARRAGALTGGTVTVGHYVLPPPPWASGPSEYAPGGLSATDLATAATATATIGLGAVNAPAINTAASAAAATSITAFPTARDRYVLTLPSPLPGLSDARPAPADLDPTNAGQLSEPLPVAIPDRDRDRDRPSRATLRGLLHVAEALGAGGAGRGERAGQRASLSSRILSADMEGGRDKGAVYLCRWRWTLGPGKEE